MNDDGRVTRPLRIDIPGGWYHAMSRGIGRSVVFGEDREREHFLGLLEEMVTRYGVKVHAYVPLACRGTVEGRRCGC